MIRLLKKSSRLDFLGFFISSFFIVITHILGIIYVFFCISYIVYKSKNKKLQLKYFLPVIIILACCTLIFLPRISMMTEYSQWWGLFTYTNILFLFSDFFSPVLTNHVNAPLKFFYNKDLAVFMVVPTIIACTGLFAGIKQKKGFAFITFFTIISMCIIAKFRLIIFITKYAIEVLPIFILLCASGFARLKKFGIVLFSLLIFFHLYAFFTPLYVTKISRPEGNKYVGEVINMRKPQVVILTYYDPDKFRRYTNFDGMRVYHISKAERQFYKQHPERIFDNVKQNERISVVFLDSVTFADKYFLQSHAELLKNKTLDIEKVPEMFLTFSYIRTCLTDILANEYKDFELDQQGSWTIITATKK